MLWDAIQSSQLNGGRDKQEAKWAAVSAIKELSLAEDTNRQTLHVLQPPVLWEGKQEVNRFINFPHTKPNKINAVVEVRAKCSYQRTEHLIPYVMTEKGFPGTYQK